MVALARVACFFASADWATMPRGEIQASPQVGEQRSGDAPVEDGVHLLCQRVHDLFIRTAAAIVNATGAPRVPPRAVAC